MDEAVSKVPGKTAVITKGESITYKEIAMKSLQAASYLKDNGIKKGDRVLILMDNSIPLLYLLFGISRIGGIAVVLNPQTSDYNLRYIIEDCSPSMLVVSHVALVDSLSAEIKIANIRNINLHMDEYDPTPFDSKCNLLPSDLALLVYTSGSTGTPKAVMCPHKNIIFCTKAISAELKIESSDVIGNFLPLSFDYGLYQVFISFENHATLALESSFSSIELLKRIKDWNITVLPSLPHLTQGLIKLLLREKTPLSLRMLTNTGEHLPKETVHELKDLLPDCKVYLMYGLTECKRVSILQPDEMAKEADSVGRPLQNVSCYVIDENNQKVPPGTAGQLVVEGPNVMTGYWNNEELTERVFRKTAEGYALYTGDFFRMDDDGYLYCIGRNDGVFKQNGYRVSTREIEQAALRLEGIEQAAVLQPDAQFEYSMLFVQTRISPSQIRQKLKFVLEGYKLPPYIEVLDEFPLTNNGKIDKNKLGNMRLKRGIKSV
ncbi:class I adenylate-forming enzyme family protein [Mesobacillus zeae]|uniref:class I adenylate-forming enzyme family protein n=1 Tax=Mesobacillus zeae TaxID=1917180 RepID=UPI0030097B66